jgi:hypothetical protein
MAKPLGRRELDVAPVVEELETKITSGASVQRSNRYHYHVSRDSVLGAR